MTNNSETLSKMEVPSLRTLAAEALGKALLAFAKHEYVRPSVLVDPIVTLVRRAPKTAKIPAYSGDRGAIGVFPAALSAGDYDTAAHMINRMIDDRKWGWIEDAFLHLLKERNTVLLRYFVERLPTPAPDDIFGGFDYAVITHLPEISDVRLILDILNYFVGSRASSRRYAESQIPSFIFAGNYEVIVAVMNFLNCYDRLFAEPRYHRANLPPETFIPLVEFVKPRALNGHRVHDLPIIRSLYLTAIFSARVDNLSFLKNSPGLIGAFLVEEDLEVFAVIALKMAFLSNSKNMLHAVREDLADVPGFASTWKHTLADTVSFLRDVPYTAHALYPFPEMFRTVLSLEPRVETPAVIFLTLIGSPPHMNAVLDAIEGKPNVPMSVFLFGMDMWQDFDSTLQPLSEYDRMLVEIARRIRLDRGFSIPIFYEAMLMYAMTRKFVQMVEFLRPLMSTDASRRWFALYDADPNDRRIADYRYNIDLVRMHFFDYEEAERIDGVIIETLLENVEGVDWHEQYIDDEGGWAGPDDEDGGAGGAADDGGAGGHRLFDEEDHRHRFYE